METTINAGAENQISDVENQLEHILRRQKRTDENVRMTIKNTKE